MNIDASRIESLRSAASYPQPDIRGNAFNSEREKRRVAEVPANLGRWPANCLFDERAAELLDQQSGELSQCGGPKKTTHDAGMFGIGTPGRIYREENRGASRFFYVAKASKSERLGSKHPTVKPIKLCRYLVKMVCPPGGTVLDPFMGSGTTGVACVREGFNFIGIDREQEYYDDARRRIEHAQKEITQDELPLEGA